MTNPMLTLSWLDELHDLDGPLDPRQLAEITGGVVARPRLWRPLVRHDPSRRWYARILLTRAVEVWLIGWAPGQSTPVHDHGGAAGALTVAEGCLVEREYDGAGDVLGRRVVHAASEPAGFAPAHVHRVLNPGPENATSIHAYSPPGLPMGRYEGAPEPAEATLDGLLARARARLERVGPEAALAAQRRGALVVDTRPAAQRAADGAIPGALVIERNVLEWRLDPASPWRIPEVRGHEQEVVVVCNEGYSSSLAAANLQELGLHRATDLAGGFQAWAAAGLPVER